MSAALSPVDARVARPEPLLLEHQLDALVLTSFEAVSYFGGSDLFTIERAGLPFDNAARGPGLGIGLHEVPHVDPGSDMPLAAGTVLNIEPFVVLRDAREAYHVEDLVLVTDQGRRLLSTPQDRALRVEMP